MCMWGQLEYIDGIFLKSSYLSKLLVDDSKFKGVVDLVFIICQYQLRSLYIHRNISYLCACVLDFCSS